MLKLKVCGLNEVENYRAISALHPDFVGLNFYPYSKRYVQEGKVFEGDNDVARVGVFVNAEIGKIKEMAKEYKLDYAQLHGDESQDYCQVTRDSGLKVIKVFRVTGDFNLNQVGPFLKYADLFLFDTESKGYGGSGKSFNWEILRDYQYPVPYFIAGGLSPDNVDRILKLNLPGLYGLDVNSGYEVAPGIKNVEKVEELIKKMRANDSNR